MSNSSNFARRALLNIPSPNPERGSYARFIPREELGEVESWHMDSFGHKAAPKPAPEAPAEPPPPAGPSAEEWQLRVDGARQAGYQAGYRDGTAALDGFKKSHAEQTRAELARLMQSLNDEFDRLHEQLADVVTRIAVQLARQVVRSELQTTPGHVATVAAEAVESVLHSARHITVHLHPADLPLVADAAQEVLQARGARLVASAGIERGGCRVESDVGAVDARIATRWAQAADALGSDQPWLEGMAPDEQ